MRARADAGDTVVIEADGAPRYVFRLTETAARKPLSRVFADATADLDLRRDKRPMRRP